MFSCKLETKPRGNICVFPSCKRGLKVALDRSVSNPHDVKVNVKIYRRAVCPYQGLPLLRRQRCEFRPCRLPVKDGRRLGFWCACFFAICSFCFCFPGITPCTSQTATGRHSDILLSVMNGINPKQFYIWRTNQPTGPIELNRSGR